MASAINVIFRLVWIQHGSVILDLLKCRSSQINLHFKSNASFFVDFAQFDMEVRLSDGSVLGRSSAVDGDKDDQQYIILRSIQYEIKV